MQNGKKKNKTGRKGGLYGPKALHGSPHRRSRGIAAASFPRNLRKIANRARNHLPKIKSDLDLLEKLLQVHRREKAKD